MEQLLDQADALVQSFASSGGAAPPTPDVPIPDEYAHTVPIRPEILVLREDRYGGRGWFAASDLPAGTLLLTAKPLALVMDWQDDQMDDDDDDHDQEQADDSEENEAADHEDGMQEDKNAEKEPRLNELLLLEILQKLKHNPSLWNEQLDSLFPRNDADLAKLPAWVCHNDDIFIQVEALLASIEREHAAAANPLTAVPNLPMKEISKRLPLILRYNILSVETCAELLSYPGPNGHSDLAGVALYHTPSFFNHSARPNVSRWCVGDVMGFTTNQDVSAGTELCISYIEHDVLCEPAWRRNRMLAMNFVDVDESRTDQQQEQDDMEEASMNHRHPGPDMPVVDSDVQNELMSMDPFARLNSIDELLAQATGSKPPTDDTRSDDHDLAGHDTSSLMETASAADGTGGDSVPWFQCDVHNLRILKAITLDGLGQTLDAFALWEESIRFVEQQLPPLDESSIVLRVQAALCAFQLGGGVVATDVARHHADTACRTHRILFGGDRALFRRRLERDMNLALRPIRSAGSSDTGPSSAAITTAVDELWPL